MYFLLQPLLNISRGESLEEIDKYCHSQFHFQVHLYKAHLSIPEVHVEAPYLDVSFAILALPKQAGTQVSMAGYEIDLGRLHAVRAASVNELLCVFTSPFFAL